MLARSPNRNAAAAYLAAPGAVAITIIERDGAARIVTGTIKGTVAARWWLTAQDACAVAARARRLAGISPDAATAIAALYRSAAFLRVTLTPDATAINRSADAVLRLDAMVERLRRDGALHEFNRRFQAGRAAAMAEGKHFMPYRVAMSRLKLALIPALVSGQSMAGIFARVFHV